MADWDAVARLRSLIGDQAGDKYEFKSLAIPPADDITRRFFAGRSRLVENTLLVYVAGVLTAPTGTIDYTLGNFDLPAAPARGTEVVASFNYQWFTDAELTEFITTACEMVRSDLDTLPAGLRPAVMDFAASFAYTRKAAEYAESVTAQAVGGSVDQSRVSPNWQALAKSAYESGVRKVEMFTQSTFKPEMRFVAYGLPQYMPES